MIFVQVLMILAFIIYVNLIGNKISTKFNLRKSINPIIGFFFVLALFHVLTIVPVILNLKFLPIFFVVTIIIVIVSILLLYKQDNISIIKSMFKEKLFYFYLFLGVLAGLLAKNDGDSWLYFPLTISSIQQNVIYPITAYVHSYDTYYLFLAFLTKIAPGNDFDFLLFSYVIFETYLICKTIFYVIDIFFKGNKVLLFISFVCLITFQSILTPVFLNGELSAFLLYASANGTLILEAISIPLFISLIYLKETRFSIWVIAFLATLSCTSSTLFVYFSLAIVDMVYTALFTRDLLKKKLDVHLKLCIMITTMVVFGFKITNIYLLIMVVLFYGFYFFIRDRLSENFIKNTIFIAAILFLILNVVGVFWYQGYHTVMSDMFSSIKKVKYPYHTKGYMMYGDNILFVILMVLGSVHSLKNDRDKFLICLVSFVMVGNYIIYRGYGSIISYAVYNRVLLINSFYLLSLSGFLYLYENIKWKKLILTITSLGFFIFFLQDGYDNTYRYLKFYDFSKPLAEFKIDNNDVLELLKFDFPKSKNLYTNDSYAWKKDVNQIFQFNTYLTRVEECDSDCYYLVPKKEWDGSTTYEYETDNFYVIYKE